MAEGEAAAAALYEIAALCPLPARRFKAAQAVADICGAPLTALRLCPPLYIDMAVQALRQSPVLPQAERNAALARAAKLFAEGDLCGLSAEACISRTARLSGLPQICVRESLDYIAEALRIYARGAGLGQSAPSFARPSGAAARAGCAQWRRKGDVLAVLAPGNAPGVHALWPQALALGYKAAVRPSAREPFTPQRLIAALAQAGFGGCCALLPADYGGAEALLRAADRALVYGGDDAVARYKTRADILTQGPGRSKILVGADCGQEAALPLIFASVTGQGGAACVCASAVLAEGDAVNAAALARAFYAYAKEKFADAETRQNWALRLSAARYASVMAEAEAAGGALAGAVESAQNADGTYYAMPLVRIAESARDPAAQRELSVASVCFAPFDRSADIAHLGETLALSAATGDEALIEALKARAEIHNLYIGAVPTVWMRPDVPHDGYLSEFLMTARGYRRL